MLAQSVAALAAAAILTTGTTGTADAAITPWDPPTAAYIRSYALERGTAVEVGGDLVEMTLDLWAYLSLAQCESGGDWHIEGRTFSGGHQWLPATWRSVGGVGLAAWAPVDEQINRARTLVERDGWGQFPGCAKRLGLS